MGFITYMESHSDGDYERKLLVTDAIVVLHDLVTAGHEAVIAPDQTQLTFEQVTMNQELLHFVIFSGSSEDIERLLAAKEFAEQSPRELMSISRDEVQIRELVA